MSEHSRIDDLRRRVQKDPSSIAFAQLAEECRRAGAYQEAIEVCRAGLQIHPGYLSARVTLGRALVEVDQIDDAEAELSRVLAGAPENLAAIRGLAEIHHRRGDLPAALVQYRAALQLARNDPDLEQTIADLSRQIEPQQPAAVDDDGGLTLQNMQQEMLQHASVPRTPSPRRAAEMPPVAVAPPIVAAPAALQAVANGSPAPGGTLEAALDERAMRTIAALEQWLAAIHVARPHPHP